MAVSQKRSKKRSGASSQSRPEPPVIFLDECVGGHRIAELFRARGLDVRIPSEPGSIPRGLPDSEWTQQVASRGWVAVTRDKRIQNRTAEKQAVAQAKLALFVLRASGNLNGDDIVDIIDRAVPGMVKFLNSHGAPFIAGNYRDGRVKLREQL